MKKRIKWRSAIIGAIVLLVSAMVALWVVSQSAQVRSLGDKPVQSLYLRDADGRVFDLAKNAASRPVLVHFWASWCPPCVEEIHAFLKAGAALAGRGTVPLFVAVAVDSDWGKVEAIVPRKKWPKEVVMLLDAESKVSEAWGSFQFPETYALNATHQVVRKWVGSQDWNAVMHQ